MLYDQRLKRSRQSMSAVPRAPASSRPTAASPAPPLVRAHAATSRFLEALPRHSRHEPVWGSSHARVRSVLTTTTMTRTDQERVALAASADADASRSSRSSFTVADASTAPVVTTREESAMVYSPSPFELQQRADVRKLIRHAHRARKLLLDRLTIVNLRHNHRCELMEEIARLKKVLASLQEQVDTTTRNVATMDRLVQHLQTISSIFTDAIQVPEATSSASAPASSAASIATAESVSLTPDAEPKSPGSSRQSSSPRSPGAVTLADDPLVVVQVEEEEKQEEEGSKEEQRREGKEKEQEEEDAQE